MTNRTQIIQVRMTEEDRKILTESANIDRRSLASFLLWAGLQKAKEKGDSA